jgi:hypothetical protein
MFRVIVRVKAMVRFIVRADFRVRVRVWFGVILSSWVRFSC